MIGDQDYKFQRIRNSQQSEGTAGNGKILDCGSRGPPFEPGWRYQVSKFRAAVGVTKPGLAASRCQGWYLSRAESTRPRLVITIQPAPRLSIDFTMPAPGMTSPGATSIEPRGLSTRAIPS